jgi:hypothetical protein
VTRAPDVQYFVEKCIRRGLATYAEVHEVGERYGIDYVDSLVQELSAAGTQLIAEEDVMISPQTNVLMNDLRLVELVSLAVQLPVAPKVRRRLHKDVIQQRSYELNLKRLDYLDNDYEWYYFSPPFNRLQRAIRRLFDSGRIPFATEWRNHKDNHAYIKGLMEHPLFAERILHKIREHYLGLREVKLLVHWIEATEEPAPVMVDIVQAGLNERGAGLVRSVLFSDRASTADSTLKSRQDVCFSCAPERRCLPLKDADDPYDILMEYRHSDLETLLKTRYPDAPIDECFLRDGLVTKFFVPYSIVVSCKRFMIDVGCLEHSTPILHKNTGRYCPYHDEWSLA